MLASGGLPEASRDLAAVGAVVDTYHVWWDERVYADIAWVGDRIASFQAAGYTGPVEVEIFKSDRSARPGAEVPALAIEAGRTVT